MHVTRVELENIKAYERAEYAFAPGTTAIVGPNGAGKTTILEAIAWALFDVLDYSKDDFLRRGAKKGTVRVTFESDLDEREYVVYRDTGNGYYVVDPLLNMRLAEKKQDVAAFLRQHLGIEPGTDLPALFRSAIGVPQGTLTADFLKPKSQREAAFNRLLKVEEYREGAQRLGDTSRLIGERVAAARERIGRAEGTLARYDETVAEHKTTAARADELSAAHATLQAEVREREAAVAALDEAERRVAETRAQSDRAAVEREAVARRLKDLRAELDAAERARARQQATALGHAAHLAALAELQRLESERAERDRLRSEADGVARLVLRAEADERRLTDALDAAARARAALAAVEPELAEQEELERERERLRDLRARAWAAGERLARLEAERQDLRAQYAQVKEQVRQAERAEGAQARVARLDSERVHIETELSKAEQAKTARQHLTEQRRELARELKRLQGTVAALERKVRELEPRARGAAEAGALEARERELQEQAARLRAEIARDEKMRAEVKGGLCPILSERCLNIGEGQTLDGYFTDHLAANSAQLKAVQTEAAQVGKTLRAARDAGLALVQLERERALLAQERALLAERERAAAANERALAALPPAAELDVWQSKHAGINAELIEARDALLRYAELEPLRQRLKEIETEGKRRKEEHDQIAATAGALAGLDKDIADVDARLRALNDPRGRARLLRAEVEREPALQTETQGARDALAALRAQARALDEQLQRFAAFDARWAETLAERDRTAAAYREYLESAALAATVEARATEVARAEAETERAERAAAEARRAHDAALAAYDRERHAEARGQLTLVRERAATTAAQSAATHERAEALAAELARLDEVRASLLAEFREKERLQGLAEATDFIRDTLKAAGPLVTESYLYNISIEANQLFREITGEAGRALRWTKEYEIVVEEGGYERSFANLSGGEQMAAALAVRLALLKQLSDIRLAFFDEPTVNMDAERRERLAQQIGQVRHFKQLFVISHDDTFEESVDHVITVPARGQEAAA
ncbi:MAG TPA: SMC family ATPase [Pyrinomonadaceae bacterium]|jgi:exonuclease SbcC